MGSLYLGGPTIQEVDGKMKMGLSIYGVAVISESLYSRFYRIHILTKRWLGDNWLLIKLLLFVQFYYVMYIPLGLKFVHNNLFSL